MIKYLTAISIGILAALAYVVNTHAAEAPRPRTSATPTPIRRLTPTVAPQQATPTPLPDTNCMPAYGGTCRESNRLSVDVRVAHPQSGEYVDNVLASEPNKYACGTDVRYLISVTNTSREVLRNVVVTTTLPAEITFKEASVKFDRNGSVLTRNIGDLQAGQKVTITLTGTLNDRCATACPTINVKATAGTEVDEDSARFCTVQGVLGEKTPQTTKGGQPIYSQPDNVTETPKSGAETLALLPLIPGMAAGFYLRRKAAK